MLELSLAKMEEKREEQSGAGELHGGSEGCHSLHWDLSVRHASVGITSFSFHRIIFIDKVGL